MTGLDEEEVIMMGYQNAEVSGRPVGQPSRFRIKRS